MRVLAIDSATSACSAALVADGRLLARRLEAMARGQSEALMPMVAAVMAEAGLTFAALDLLAATVGPGAFTGIRIGLAAARGLALATGLPLVGVSTLEAVAHGVPEPDRHGRPLLVVLESKREELWVQRFAADLSPASPLLALPPDRAAALAEAGDLLVGDAAAAVAAHMAAPHLSSAPGWPDAAVVAALAVRHRAAGTALPAEPLYLRAADVTLPSCPSP